jgi:serine/threonine-protein kinase
VVKKPLPKNFWWWAGGAGAALIALVIIALLVISRGVAVDDTTIDPLPPVDIEQPDDSVQPPPFPLDLGDTETDPNPAPPTTDPTTVTVPETDILGKTQGQVADILSALGLRLDAIPGNTATSQEEVGAAYRVNPRGVVAPGTLIAVYFYSPIPSLPPPIKMAISAPDATGYNPEDLVTLSWPAYAQCPSGFPVSGYRLEIVGGTLTQPTSPSVGSNVTQATVTLGSVGTLRASYVVTCQSLTSPRAPELSVAIVAEPVEEPSE